MLGIGRVIISSNNLRAIIVINRYASHYWWPAWDAVAASSSHDKLSAALRLFPRRICSSDASRFKRRITSRDALGGSTRPRRKTAWQSGCSQGRRKSLDEKEADIPTKHPSQGQTICRWRSPFPPVAKQLLPGDQSEGAIWLNYWRARTVILLPVLNGQKHADAYLLTQDKPFYCSFCPLMFPGRQLQLLSSDLQERW